MVDPINPNKPIVQIPVNTAGPVKEEANVGTKDDSSNTSAPSKEHTPPAKLAVPYTLRPEYTIFPTSICCRIVEEAIQSLKEIGLLVKNEEAKALLHGAGARIDGERVYFPETLVEQALRTAPHQVILQDRYGNPVMDLSGDHIYFTPGSTAPQILDSESNTVREPITADLETFARLTDALPYYTAQSTALVPADVPQEIQDSYRLYVALLNSSKPIVTGVFRKESFPLMYNMLAIVAGGKDKLRENPLAIFDCCPLSPFTLTDDQTQSLIDCARAGIPVEIVSAPLASATALATRMGTVVQHCAESLGALVVHQLAAPGASVIYGGCGMLFGHSTPLIGAPETMQIQSASMKVGKYLRLPTHCYMGLSDAKLVDYQAGMESMLGLFMAAQSGINNIAGAGMLEGIKCQSLDKLVLDHEAWGIARYLASGITVWDDPFLVLSAIRDGIKEEFFLLDHTLKLFRQDRFFPSPVIERDTREGWQQRGGKDILHRTRDHIKKLLTKHTPKSLPEHIEKELTECMKQARYDANSSSSLCWIPY